MTALSNHALADRIAALDWSATSLQHQLAVAAAVETLKARDVVAVAHIPETLAEVARVLPFRAPLPPSLDTLPSVEYSEQRETNARQECTRREIDPDAVCADGGVTAWMVMDKEMQERATLLPDLRSPSLALLQGVAYTPERRVTLVALDGTPVANALCSRNERWDWIVETVCEICRCDPEQVACEDDTVTVDGLPAFEIC